MDEADTLCAVMHCGEVHHVRCEGAVLLRADAGGKGAVQVGHGFQPAFRVTGGQTAVAGSSRLDTAVAPMAFNEGPFPPW